MAHAHLVAATRRAALLGAAAVLTTAAAPARYKYAPADGDMSLGKPTAPVTIIEYGSVGCPHCAHWDTEVFPQLKAKYIDTGQVRFVFREMLTGQPQLAALGFMTARCVPAKNYFDVIHELFARQAAIIEGRQLRPPLVEIAQKYGLAEPTWEACVMNDAKFAELRTRVERNAGLDNVQYTPFFVVNGKPMGDAIDLAAFDKAIAAAKA